MALTFVMPGTADPEISVRRRFLLHPAVGVDGVALRNVAGPIGAAYLLPMTDGAKARVRIKGYYTGLTAVVDGVEVPLERRLGRLGVLAIFLPFAATIVAILLADWTGHVRAGASPLVALGGGLLAIVALRAAAHLLHGGAKPVAKAAGIAVLCLATGAYGWASQPPPAAARVLAVGTCLDVGRGGLLAPTTPTVDCSQPHLSEVTGVVPLGGQAAYPGTDPLTVAAKTQCAAIFAAYVGRPPDGSLLASAYVLPSAAGWGRGDTSVTCLVWLRDGSQLSGSVRGTGR